MSLCEWWFAVLAWDGGFSTLFFLGVCLLGLVCFDSLIVCRLGLLWWFSFFGFFRWFAALASLDGLSSGCTFGPGHLTTENTQIFGDPSLSVGGSSGLLGCSYIIQTTPDGSITLVYGILVHSTESVDILSVYR